MSSRVGRPAVKEPDDYYVAAYELLGKYGFRGLTVPALCNRLGVTKGAFYHHFKDLPGFVAAFGDHWQKCFLERFDTWLAEGDLKRRLEIVGHGSIVAVRPEMRAMRAWALVNPTISGAMANFDRGVRALSSESWSAATGHEESGLVLSAMTPAVCVGIQYRPRPISPSHFLRVVSCLYQGLGIENEIIRGDGKIRLKVISLDRLESLASTRPDLEPPAEGETDHSLGPAAFWRQVEQFDGAQERYFAAAAALLRTEGTSGLTVSSLVEHLGVTKGSFHHHFENLENFVNQLADAWETTELARIEKLIKGRNPRSSLERLLSDLLLPPDRAEIAWRAWGQGHPVIGSALRCVDSHRERGIASTIDRLLNTAEAGLLAEMTLGLGLGLYSWNSLVDRKLMYRAAIEWMDRVVGIEAAIRTESGVPLVTLKSA